MRAQKVDYGAMAKEMELNLSDFALFLTVMKNKEAHESTLSIIMEDPNLKLEEVHVEEVVLNKIGKRAIRLDAWAKDTDGVQYNMEMQNDTRKDDVRKRSRFYQGMIDTPVLKAGKQTKYKELPSTVIIFITQEDIFGRDRAKYTFTEQCEEIADLHLEDGTTKVFLNMTSKNGTPELVSLLQYMKHTRLDNPEILIKDKRIQKIDEVVAEVKESEEWEATRMSIYSLGWDAGEEAGWRAGEEAGWRAGEEAGWKAGEEAGRKLGEEIGWKAGEEVGRKAGEEAGRKLGEEIGWKAGEEAGREAGRKAGKKIGEETFLIKTVCKKLRKGKTAEQIADEIEEDLDKVRPICELAETFAPEYEDEKVTEIWLEQFDKI